MNWKDLLSARRIGDPKGVDENALASRTEFTRDYDRIIFSSAFRRMQDKTQVFPLAKSDYIRTRLTHSLEVASVGRSLGMLASEVILRKSPGDAEITKPHELGTIVSAACLMHDIGNPAFGHAGESAIQEWFESREQEWSSQLNEQERLDLLKFEGNAQGFRTICSLQNPDQAGGLQLTSAVMGTFAKYPRASFVSSDQALGISGKKFGFMKSEEDAFCELAEELGLVRKSGPGKAWHRHPLAFLLEAADDICYNIMDAEDGFKSGLIPFEALVETFRPWLTERNLQRGESIALQQRKIEYFRAVTVNKLISEFVDVFDQVYAGLLDGSFDDEFSKYIENAAAFRKFSDLVKEKVYPSKAVIEIEACGFEVTAGLLNAFVDAAEVVATGSKTGKVRARTILNLLPGGSAAIKGKSLYQRLIVMTDFVSGMTDSYAVNLYQRIRGISLP